RLHADLSALAVLPSADRSVAAPPRAAAGSFAGLRAPAAAMTLSHVSRAQRSAKPSPREAGRGWPERSEGRVRGKTLVNRSSACSASLFFPLTPLAVFAARPPLPAIARRRRA